MYAEIDDLQGMLPDDWADQFTDDDGAGGDPSKLSKALVDASNWVDGFLARYGPPIVLGTNGTQVTLDVLEVHTLIVAKHEILGRKVGPEGYRNTDESYQATKAFLMAIQKGAPLPGATEPTPNITTASVTGSVTAGEIVFNDDSAVL